MKIGKRGLAVLLSVALVAGILPQSGTDADAKGKPTSIQIKAPFSAKGKKVTTTLTLKKGSTFRLKTKVFPVSASKKLVYKSSKEAIATVSSKGKIKAIKVGKTTITIRSKKNKKVKAVIKVTVVKKLKRVKKIELNKTTLALSKSGANRKAQLKATIVSPKKPTTKKFNWFSSNKNVATVNKKGRVTAKKAGTAKITVTSADGRGARAVCSVTVDTGKIQVEAPFSAKGKKVTTTLMLKKGSTFQVQTKVFPESSSKKLIYKSSKKAIASVSSKGEIKAKQLGKTTITIQPDSNKNVEAVIKVTVVKKLKEVKEIKLDKTTLSLFTSGTDRTAQLKATIVSPEKPTTKKFNWFTSNKNVADVDKHGLVTAKKAGTAKITVTSADGQGAMAVCRVTVTAAKIQVNAPFSEKGKKVATTLTLQKGSTFQTKTSVFPASASKNLVYKSSKEAIASVSSKGKIKAKEVGKTTITIRPKDNKKVEAAIKVTVVKKLKEIKEIELDKTTLSLFTAGANRKAQLKATIVSPKKPTIKEFNWFSSNQNVADVNKNGLVTAKKAGTAKITVTSADGHGAKAVCSVTVTTGNSTPAPSSNPYETQAPTVPSNGPDTSTAPSNSPNAPVTPAPDAVPSIVVPGERTGIKQGETLQLTAKDEKTGATMTDVIWSVNTLEGVSVDNTGLLTVAKTAAAGEEITVTATNSNGSDTAVFHIIENKVPEITENMLQMNQGTADAPLGLTYRSDDACSPASDPERGEVVRFDAGKGYTSDSDDELAWMVVDPMYAGKTVTFSAYMKYDAIPDVSVMDLVIKEGWSDGDSASEYNAEPDTWYYVSGTYTLPENDGSNYDGDLNRLYIARDSVHLGIAGADTVNAVYYIDDLTLTVEKSEIESVELSAAEDADTIYQNHTLQFTSKVYGTDAPMQKVIYSIDPPVEGATISENGLLTVRNVAADTEITVKAAAYEDPGKYATKTIKVLAQTIDSIQVSADGSPETIYQNGTLQFSAEVTGTGDPDLSVSWSLDKAVNDVIISNDGLLTVGKNAPADTKLTVTATSNFDKTKSASYEITILPYGVISLEVHSFGNPDDTIRPGDSVNLFARVVTANGDISDDVIWSLTNDISGVSLVTYESDSKICTLRVTDAVSHNTRIEIQAASKEDADKKDSITITVDSAAAKVFSIDDTMVTYWQDFDHLSTTSKLYDPDGTFNVYNTGINLSYFKAHASAKNKYTGRSMIISSVLNYPVTETGTSTLTYKSNGFTGYLNSTEDYYSFLIKNDEQEEKTYTLSFFADFLDVVNEDAQDVVQALEEVLKGDKNAFDYKLPLKVVDETGSTLASASLGLRCYSSRAANYVDFQEFIVTVKVPAGGSKTLKLMAESLPTCLSDSHKSSTPEAANAPHPVQVCIDNISIVKRDTDSTPVINLKVGDKYPINITKGANDAVAYTTNDFLSYLTHTHLGMTAATQGPQLTCPIEGEIPRIADVDYETGIITALGAGQTMVTAAITSGGDTTYKQCIIKVSD